MTSSPARWADTDPNESDPRLRDLIDRSLEPLEAAELDHRLYETAAHAGAIVGCRYAAISVLGPENTTERFIAFGVDRDVIDRIGRLPEHRGLLGVVIDDAVTVRTDDIAMDSRTVGLPAEHPPIESLLGVPIMLRGRVAGGLFLSQRDGGDGFADSDEPVAHAIAAAAANVIERARTAAENARRDRWLTGAEALTREIATAGHERPLAIITERLLEIADADLVAVLQPGPSDATIVVTAASGHDADKWDGYILPTEESLAAGVMRTGKARIITQVTEEAAPMDARHVVDIESALMIPLRGTATSSNASITIGRRPGRRAFTAGELGMATMFGGQIALALELAEMQARRDQVALVEERDRIARDLHDHVIQRLFAVGLSLQSAGMHVAGRPAEQILNGVDEIDETIKQIRSTIYRLTVPIVSPRGSIRIHATRLIDDLVPVLGFRPTLEVEGPVEFGLDEQILDDGVAVLREALTNVARHARATRAAVSVRIADGTLAIGIQDNGRGIGSVTRRSGLSNMRARAERRGGSLVCDSSDSSGSHGTKVTWSVPLKVDHATACAAD